MEMTYGANWLKERPPATGSALSSVISETKVSSTSGVNRDTYKAQKYLINYQLPVSPKASLRTPVENLERVREVFSPGMSNLAEIFGVSRQTIYNWLNGESPRVEYITKLQDLADAADMITDAGIPLTPRLLKRPVAGGKSLFTTARDGGSIQAVAQQLIALIQHELEQRKQMDAQLSGRKITTRSVESDFPAENDIR